MSFDPKDARALLELHQQYHSEFQIDHFITERAGLTPWGMFRQALRELAGRFEGMKQLAFQRELALIKAAKHERRAAAAGDDELERRERIVKATRARAQVDSIDRNVRDTWRELLRFYAHAKALRAQLPPDLTHEVQAKLEAERWEALVRRMVALDFETTGRTSSGTIEAIWALPMESRERVLQARHDPGALVEELNTRPPALPDFEALAAGDLDAVAILEATTR